jgi:hypothetical protein
MMAPGIQIRKEPEKNCHVSFGKSEQLKQVGDDFIVIVLVFKEADLS